jgi:hypothetical protein
MDVHNDIHVHVVGYFDDSIVDKLCEFYFVSQKSV